MRKVTTLLQRLTDHEHAEQEEYDIQVDGLEGFSRRDLSREQYRQCPEQHRLPYLKAKPADLPDGNEDKNHQQNDY